MLLRTSSLCASSVPVVASVHHASLDAFSTGARRFSKEVIKLCMSLGEIVTECLAERQRRPRAASLRRLPR
jgi:hypothetical protein